MPSPTTGAVRQRDEPFGRKSERLSGPALKAFFAIEDVWGLSSAQARVLLGSLPESTYFRYLKNPESAKLARDTLERISHILGIYKALNILLPRRDAADEWIHQPNDAPLFKGRSALAYMLGGSFDDISAVRRYLDAERSW